VAGVIGLLYETLVGGDAAKAPCSLPRVISGHAAYDFRRHLKGIGMGHRNPNGRRRIAAAAAVGLAVALATVASGPSSFAQSAAEDEDVPLDTKLMRQFLKDLGLRRDGEGIDYRERAPLVVPPSRNLPPPQSEASVTANPAWPKDPDAQQRKVEAAKKKLPNRTAAETMEAEGRPISRSELDRGKIAPGTSANAGGPQYPDESARAMRPSELGSKSFFSDIFSSFSDKGETGTFTGEPTRESLTAPPAGYQTPSPAQPYGLAPKQAKGKAATVEDRAAGTTR